MPYRLTVDALWLIELVGFFGLIWIDYKRCVYMFDVYTFQILRLLTECLTNCLAVLFTDIDLSGPSTTPRS